MKIGPYYVGEWFAAISGIALSMTACLLLMSMAGPSPDIWTAPATLGCLTVAFLLFKFFVPSDTVRHLRDRRSDLIRR